jgi:hypothetical protein
MSAYNPFLPYDDSRDADESTTDHTVEFDKLVQKLKRAYCDAYMTSLNIPQSTIDTSSSISTMAPTK